MILCPFCDGQGIIYKAKVKGISDTIYICDECDTMWRTLGITTENCESFNIFMSQLGYKALWSELSEVEILTDEST